MGGKSKKSNKVKVDESVFVSLKPIGEDKPFIRTDVLETLMRGSMEDKIDRVSKVVGENRSKYLRTEGSDVDVKPVATFDNHVIVATDEGKLFRSEYSEGEAGMSLGNFEEIEMPGMDHEQLKDYKSEMLDRIVDKFCQTMLIDGKEILDLVYVNDLLAS